MLNSIVRRASDAQSEPVNHDFGANFKTCVIGQPYDSPPLTQLSAPAIWRRAMLDMYAFSRASRRWPGRLVQLLLNLQICNSAVLHMTTDHRE